MLREPFRFSGEYDGLLLKAATKVDARMSQARNWLQLP